jgi:hypothetical protein
LEKTAKELLLYTDSVRNSKLSLDEVEEKFEILKKELFSPKE